MQGPDHGWRRPEVSLPALEILALLLAHGGTGRIRMLLNWSHQTCDELCASLNELDARGWIEVTWRRPRADLPQRLRRVDRATATPQARRFAPFTRSQCATPTSRIPARRNVARGRRIGR